MKTLVCLKTTRASFLFLLWADPKNFVVHVIICLPDINTLCNKSDLILICRLNLAHRNVKSGLIHDILNCLETEVGANLK